MRKFNIFLKLKVGHDHLSKFLLHNSRRNLLMLDSSDQSDSRSELDLSNEFSYKDTMNDYKINGNKLGNVE